MIADEDKKLPENDMVYKLATPSKIKDLSWITPSKGTDEWIIDINLFNIPFKAGINTETYKYYIDFAKRFGFDRIMMDAGWSDRNDLFNIIPEINMDTLSAYAKSKNIKLSMWTLALTLDKQLDSALLQFKKWGVDFIMTDFIDRDDQKMVNFYERIAKACAEQQIMIMYHGAPAPKGFNRTYPNAIGREGVLGSEYSIWSQKVTPQHNLILPFTRMLAGPLDYEPGFLNNVNQKSFRNIEGNPMSYGTRCHQLAMFVVYDSPIQIFSGNPSQGYFEPSFMELLGSIPTGWDETIVLDAKIGEYIVTARKKNNDWYIAGMNNWNSKEQIINLDFLDGSNYNATICIDGINAEKFAADYSISQSTLNKNDKISIKSAPGGGFLLKLSKN
jgi:alpha-glucosidase